ncbi:MAG: HAMP domain-containing sensor histidine kinase [Rhizobium sp.]|nr:HAMP domain-containing sensor histidine kinase [Rhizobium sp.]
MLEKLLQLSRAEAGVGLSSTLVDLLALVKLLVETFQRSHPTAMIELRPEPALLGLVRAIDPDAFAIAFNNLLENAARYGDAEQPVTIAISADGRITVTNAVSVPLDPDLNVYRARFRRGQTSKPGAGLGLAIVEKLVAQMSGSMSLRTVVLPEGRTGFECELSLPPPKQ